MVRVDQALRIFHFQLDQEHAQEDFLLFLQLKFIQLL